jgi:hypothetical protein
MSKVIIIRGPSGSGKTTIARSIERKEDEAKYGKGHTRIMGATYGPRVVFHEADQFFTSEFGDEYNFDPTKLSQAHRWCQLNVERTILIGCDAIVSNTSMSKWELNPYLQLAEQYGCELEVWRTPGPWDAETLFARNIHGVPLATLEKQISKYQPLDDEQEWSNMDIFNE